MDPLTRDDPPQVGKYRVHARLGAGGMGAVYLAFTPGGRPVALKMIRPELADDAGFRNRFRQEVDAARRVHGLYTAQVLDADPDAGSPWLVTAYVPGLSLQEGVSRNGPLPVDSVLVLMAGVAEALEVIHRAGIVHRDLKPSNVVLAPDGPRVIDFGIARSADMSSLTASGMRIGSPRYMAPEQISESPVGPAADVFSLGSLAAYAALGRSPFGDGEILPVMYRVLHQPPDLSGCPAPLYGIIERCLAKNAADRPAPAEIISSCRAATAGRTYQIPQPWLPPGVVAAMADRPPLPSPASADARDRLQAGAPPPGQPAADGRGRPAGVIAGEQRRPGASRTAPTRPAAGPNAGPTAPTRPATAPTRPAAGPTARLPARRRRRPRRAAASLLGLLVLAAVLTWLAHSGTLAAGSDPARTPASAASSRLPTSPTSPAAQPATSWLAGTWAGSADQPSGVVTHWTVELVFSRSGRGGTFRFPSLGCSGTLTVTATTATTASVDEHLTRNPRKVCVSRGLMTLSRSGGTVMHMRWQDASDRSNIATGSLKPR